MFGKGDPLARDRSRDPLLAERSCTAGPENAGAMPQGMETSRRYRGERAFLRDADRMKSDGWRIEEARFTPAHRRLHALRPNGSRSRLIDVHYLR